MDNKFYIVAHVGPNDNRVVAGYCSAHYAHKKLVEELASYKEEQGIPYDITGNIYIANSYEDAKRGRIYLAN